jgi:hypothetical protein
MVKFKIIYESEQQASTFRVNIVGGFRHDVSTRKPRYELSDTLPGLVSRCSKFKRHDMMICVDRITRHAVGRGRARG